MRMTSVGATVDYQQTVENLKVKLSLKKQVWNGVAGVNDQQTIDNAYQPLSWGTSVPTAKKKHLKPDSNEELFA